MSLERFPNSMLASYNGHTFSALAETVELRITPVYDAAGRTVIYSVYFLVIKEILSPAVGGLVAVSAQAITAAFVTDAVAKLSRPAGAFKYQGRGFGDLNINIGAGGKRDVIYGPKPKVTSLKPHGGQTVELTWTVEVAIPNCLDATFRFAVMEFCFKLQYNRDRQGYTDRIYSGFVRIPATRRTVDDRRLTDSADAYLEKIYPPLLPGFRRIPGTWVLDESKQTGTFSITDEQMPPNAPPPGVIEVTANHIYQGTSLVDWTGTITATYDIDRASGTPAHATRAFVDLIKTRTADAGRMIVGRGLDFGPGLPKKVDGFVGKAAFIRPIRASAEEPNIFGRTQVKLSFTYAVAGVSFDEIMKLGGLWEKLTEASGGNHRLWASSVATTLSARGHARLNFNPGTDDAIVDLCGDSKPTPPYTPAPFDPRQYPSPNNQINGILGAFPPPTPANSWLAYTTMVTIHADTGRVIGTTLPTKPLAPARGNQNPAWDLTAGLPGGTNQSGGPFPPLNVVVGNQSQNTGGETFVQQRTKPRLYITVSGRCARCGYSIPVPELVAVNGAKPTLVGAPYFRQGVIESGFIPVVGAEFSLTYLFTDDEGMPSGVIPVLPNPLLA